MFFSQAARIDGFSVAATCHHNPFLIPPRRGWTRTWIITLDVHPIYDQWLLSRWVQPVMCMLYAWDRIHPRNLGCREHLWFLGCALKYHPGPYNKNMPKDFRLYGLTSTIVPQHNQHVPAQLARLLIDGHPHLRCRKDFLQFFGAIFQKLLSSKSGTRSCRQVLGSRTGSLRLYVGDTKCCGTWSSQMVVANCSSLLWIRRIKLWSGDI